MTLLTFRKDSFKEYLYFKGMKRIRRIFFLLQTTDDPASPEKVVSQEAYPSDNLLTKLLSII